MVTINQQWKDYLVTIQEINICIIRHFRKIFIIKYAGTKHLASSVSCCFSALSFALPRRHIFFFDSCYEKIGIKKNLLSRRVAKNIKYLLSFKVNIFKIIWENILLVGNSYPNYIILFFNWV